MQGLKRTFFIVCIATGSFCSAQKFNTPEAYSFQEEVFRPISYYTGQANISIPLFNIQTNEITIPVTLNYVGGAGLRAINPYSSVGLGWRLTAGGAIVRSKNGTCDENGSPDGVAPSGIFNLPANSVANSYVRNNVSSYIAHDANGRQYFGPSIEYSPDVFSFSFLGYSGYFLMGYDGKFKIQSQEIDSVEKFSTSNWPGGQNTVYFRLTTKDGTKFTFGSDKGSIEFSGGNGSIPFQADAWYLTAINFINGKSVSFQYQDNTNNNNLVRYVPSSEVGTFLVNGPVVLDKIFFDGGKLTSITEVVTQKITGSYSYPWLIDNLKLQDANNKVVSNILFSYSPENNQRYFLLDSIAVNDKKYRFSYYKRANLPSEIESFGTDYWGYYNGGSEVTTVGTGNVISFWDMYLNPTVTYPARMPNEEYSKRGILTSTTYPTGDVETYEYEPNTYSYLGAQTNIGLRYSFSEEPKKAGGLRIAKITKGNMVRKYKYVNSFDPTKPDYDPQTMSYIGYSSSGILYRLPGVPYYGRSAINALSIEGEPSIVYSKVIEFLSDRSYTEYTLRSPLDKPDGDNNQNTAYYAIDVNEPTIFNYYT